MDDQHPAKRAPGRLELVEQFINSIDFDDGDEQLGSPAELGAFLAERGLMSAEEPVSEGDLRRAVDVREGLRALALANNGVELDSAAVERLDRAASRAGLRVQSVPGGRPRLEPDAGGVDGALAELLAAVVSAVADGSWQRFKACPRDSCRWAFYDHSKNRSGRWCDMSSCGNVEKARAYRERHRGHSRA
jgi:predicted RNA-binding Zn ribbon-like protein